MDRSIFIPRFAEDIRNEQAAIFVGAGISMNSNLPSWKEFAEDFAKELGLDIESEKDLISLFQYYVNERRCRNGLNQRIFRVLGKDVPTNATHAALSALPVRTYWTTNCDELLEKAFRANDKTVFVKRRKTDLTLQKPDSDITLYKMHGDVQDPQHAVFTKDDYEYYPVYNAPFLDHLRSDLCSKTFLFIGFSMDDPNLKHALSQLHISLGDSMREHYLIYKSNGNLPKKAQEENDSFEFRQHAETCEVGPDYEVTMSQENRLRWRKKRKPQTTPRTPTEPSKEEKRRIEQIRKHEKLWIDDLARYGIQTIVIDDFAEIPQILNKIREKINMKEIFISGSFTNFDQPNPDKGAESAGKAEPEENGTAASASPVLKWNSQLALGFSYDLAMALVSKGNQIITGFGAGVGNGMIRAILTYSATNKSQKIEKCVLGLPFNQDEASKSTLKTLWRDYRQNSLKQAGIAIFIFGEASAEQLNSERIKHERHTATSADKTEQSEQASDMSPEQKGRAEQRAHKDNIITKSSEYNKNVAEGMMEEFRIACEQESCFVIPVAATGRTPSYIWNLIKDEIEHFLPLATTDEQKEFNNEVISKLRCLNRPRTEEQPSEMIKNIIQEITDLIAYLQQH